MTMNCKLLILLASFGMYAFSQVDSTGIKLLSGRQFTEAQSFFESAIKKNSKDADAHYYLALSFMGQRNLDDAEDEIDEAIDLNEHVSKYHIARGNILGLQTMNANPVSQAFLAPKVKNAYLRGSELDPNNIEARQALYNYYVMAPGIMGGSEEKAFEQANAIVKLNPFRGYMMLANFHMRVNKDTIEAEKQIKKAISAEPERGDGYKQLGYHYLNRKRFQDAYIQMQKFIDAEPKNPDSYDSYGDVFKAEKKYDQAIEKYHRALSVDKTFSASIYSLAECYELKGQRQKAKETFQWFIAVDPHNRRADTAQKKIKEL